MFYSNFYIDFCIHLHSYGLRWYRICIVYVYLPKLWNLHQFLFKSQKSRHFTAILQKVGKARKITTEVQGQSSGTKLKVKATRSRVGPTRHRQACPSKISRARPDRASQTTWLRTVLEGDNPLSRSTKISVHIRSQSRSSYPRRLAASDQIRCREKRNPLPRDEPPAASGWSQSTSPARALYSISTRLSRDRQKP